MAQKLSDEEINYKLKHGGVAFDDIPTEWWARRGEFVKQERMREQKLIIPITIALAIALSIPIIIIELILFGVI
jgi:hypothetical protein